MSVIQEGNVAKKHFFFEVYFVWFKEQFQPASIIKWQINIFITKEYLQPSIIAC